MVWPKTDVNSTQLTFLCLNEKFSIFFESVFKIDGGSCQPVDAPLAELLARQVEVSQVCVSQTLDKILLDASSCGHNHIHLTQS